jgi:tubulin polyglutamylase TTLL5
MVDRDLGGTKCTFSQLRERLASAGVDVETLWTRIVDVVLRSLHAVHDAIPANPNAFELFGYDVLVDESLKPWLIEVNSSPSLDRDNPLDVKVKDALLADTLSLIAPPHFDRTIWREMLRWRIGERTGERSGGRTTPSLAAELCALLHGTTPRAYGQPVHSASMGLYERIAPSAAWDRVSTGKAARSGGGVTARPASRPRFAPMASRRTKTLAEQYL